MKCEQCGRDVEKFVLRETLAKTVIKVCQGCAKKIDDVAQLMNKSVQPDIIALPEATARFRKLLVGDAA